MREDEAMRRKDRDDDDDYRPEWVIVWFWGMLALWLVVGSFVAYLWPE